MASTAITSQHVALDRLEGIAELPADWDSYGAEPPSSVAIAGARKILTELAQSLARSRFRVEPWALGARADGGVMIEWRGPLGALEVHIEPDGVIGYLFESSSPESVHQIEASNVTIDELALVLNQPPSS